MSNAIHQEVLFKAKRGRVYEALTDTKQFDEVTRFSAAMKQASLQELQLLKSAATWGLPFRCLAAL